MSEKDSALVPKSQNKTEVITFLCILSQGILFCNILVALKEKKKKKTVFKNCRSFQFHSFCCLRYRKIIKVHGDDVWDSRINLDTL